MTINEHPPDDRVKRLLADANLSTADVDGRGPMRFFASGGALRLDGVVGLEVYGDIGLLRSLAVAPTQRGRGLGAALVAHAERVARDQGVTSLYLLTETAERFFAVRGYALTPRGEAPAVIRSTPEFSAICPTSAAFMMKRL